MMSGIKSTFAHIYKSKNVKNSFWIIGEQIFQILLSLIVGALSARYLGPENYGTLNYTASFVAFFINVASLCMEGVVVKKLVEHPESEGVYLGSCILFRVLSATLSVISIAVIVCVINPGDYTKLALVALQSLQLFFKAFNIFDSWFQRYLNSKYTSIGKMVASISVSVYKIILLVTARSVYWFAFANTLSDLIVAFLLFFFYKKNNGQKLAVNMGIGREVLSESYHFILSEIMAALYINIDRIMIGKMISDHYVGIYIAASTVSTMWSFVPIALINSYRPTIMELKVQDEERYRVRLTQLFSLIIWVCIAFSTLVFVIAAFLVKLLYGEAYLEAVGALKILTWSQLFAVISLVRSLWILCEDKNRFVKYYVAIGTIMNIVLNLVLIPYYGIEGASLATLFTSVIVLVFAPLIFAETRGQTQYMIDGFLLTWLFKRES